MDPMDRNHYEIAIHVTRHGSSLQFFTCRMESTAVTAYMCGVTTEEPLFSLRCVPKWQCRGCQTEAQLQLNARARGRDLPPAEVR